MNENKRAWGYLSKEQRRATVDEIIGFFLSERNETIGVVAAENILDFFLQTAGSTIYNSAIDDVKPFLTKEFEDMLVNIDVTLRKQVELKRKKKNSPCGQLIDLSSGWVYSMGVLVGESPVQLRTS